MTPATMCASTTADAIVVPLMTTPQATDAARKRRIAGEACKRFEFDRLASPMDAGIASAVIRRRNTQYVHAWLPMISGSNVSDAHVMIFSVYGVDDPL